jgi:hypothetical protein
MNEILDEIKFTNPPKTFSKLSLMAALITCGLTGYLFSSFPKMIKVSEGFPEFYLKLIGSIFACCLFGLIMMILSVARKEPSTWYKWLGVVLNTLICLCLLGSIIFASTF